MAIFVTLIVLLILAGVSISGLFSEKGLFKRTENASNRYNEAKAREVLETVLLVDGQYEKNINKEYNQDDFLDELIKSEIPGSNVKGDVVIIGEYAFELDRSVPKIGRPLGKEDKLVFPTLIIGEVNLTEDNREGTFTITAKEENGIDRIEVWLNGLKLDTIPGNNQKILTTIYTVYKNGEYTIKAYGDLMASKKVTVEGIVPTVTFTPNENKTYKKKQTTTITIEETEDKVKSIKYKWSQVKPVITEFSEECLENNIITGTSSSMTGIYYCWVLIETESGKKYISESGEFYFDNEGPNIIAFDLDKYSETGITYSVSAQDDKTGIDKIEFYVDNIPEPKKIIDCEKTKEKTTKSTTIEDITTGTHSCKIIVYDTEGNNTSRTKNGTTKLYVWDTYNVKSTTGWSNEVISDSTSKIYDIGEMVTACRTIVWDTMNGPTTEPNDSTKITETLLSYAKYRCTDGVPDARHTYLYTQGSTKKEAWRVSKCTHSGTNVWIYGRLWECKKVTNYDIGDSRNETVTNSNINQYPENGRVGSIWYVRRSKPE